jgi:DNA-binding NarL/FixJ family response regulator
LDEAAAQVLRRVLEELSIRVESCPELPRAAIRLAQERFDAVILDCYSQAEVTTLLRETRLSRLNDSTLAVAVVQGQESIREMFSLGVNFVLYKPVSYERALSSLRAARSVMRKEKRRSARASVHTHATIDYANVAQEKATLMDLSEAGMSVLFGKKLPPTSKVYFQFQLPGQSASVRLSGQVMWQDWNGRAGVQFVDVPKTSRRLVSDFLHASLPNEQKPEELFSKVTVELEEPLQVAAPELVGVEMQGHASKAREDKTERTAEVKAESASQTAADNRRGQTRYSCRLGAEVYRTGIAVPNHCCLTDLSAGGCYLEMPLPFSKGTSVEITVRTYELKLRVRGVVQASHPGYGMGAAFELKTKEERDEVQKLTDYVASQAESSS